MLRMRPFKNASVAAFREQGKRAIAANSTDQFN